MSLEKLKEPSDLEEWRPVVGYEGWYSVSSLGRVRSEERVVKGNANQIGRRFKSKMMRQWTHTCGYLLVDLKRDGIRKHCRVHRLVAEAFLGPPPTGGHEPNHKNRVRTDNRSENLEWTTRSENLAHSWANPLRDRTGMAGTNNGSAKATESDARDIRSRYLRGEAVAAIARHYSNFHHSTVWLIATGKTWKHLEVA